MDKDGAGSGVMLLPVVAAALVDVDRRVLLQRRRAGRSHAGLWEFPGGKIEVGETPEQALSRELDEELTIAVDPAAMTACGFASAPLGDRHLVLLLYLVRTWTGHPRPVEASALDWWHPADMRALAMPPADAPLIALLEKLI